VAAQAVVERIRARCSGVTQPRPPRLLGPRELAAQPMELRLEIEGPADPGPPDGLREAFARLPGLAHGVRPGPLQMHDLGAVHQALAAIGHEVRLRRAPLAERLRPLLRPAQVEELLAFPDHGAVDDPDPDRRHFTGGDGNHDLVEQRHAGRGLSRPDEGLADAEATERHELRIAEALADPRRLVVGGVEGRIVTRPHAPERLEHEQVPALHAVVPAIVQQPLAPGQPAAALRRLALDQRGEAEPERAPRRPRGCAASQERVVRPRPGVGALGVAADQVRGDRKALEVFGLEGRLAIPGRELLVRIPPGLPLERCPALIE
jgi:hypothetical protein